MEGFPSGQREQTVNLSAHAFVGSNPTPSTSIVFANGWDLELVFFIEAQVGFELTNILKLGSNKSSGKTIYNGEADPEGARNRMFRVILPPPPV